MFKCFKKQIFVGILCICWTDIFLKALLHVGMLKETDIINIYFAFGGQI